MKATTKFFHSIVSRLNLEELLIQLQTLHPSFLKFIPSHREYKEGEVREVKRAGVNYRLQISDYMQWCIYADVSDNSWLEAKKCLKENHTVLDIGANSGAFCLKLAQVIHKLNFKNVKVHAFEPNPFVSAILKQNLELNTHLKEIVEINEIGLGNENTIAKLSFDSNNTGAGKIDASLTKGVEVEIKRLDTFVESKGINQISFIKLDVEGFEPLVIEGGKATIRKFRPTLYIEITDKWFRNHGYTKEFIYDFLREEKYQLFIESAEKFIPLDLNQDEIEQFNILAVPE